MPAPQQIIDLVAKFERNIEDYKRSHNETQIRREFIDPFFGELGWDMDNLKTGAAPQYQDVIHEDKQKVGDSMKAPDYAFRIGGAKKFYVEAKKPSVWVKEAPAPAFQVRSYGWSAKLPVSIVTDFEEFAVYDCTQKPKNGDKPSVARINYFSYKEYVERWDEIADVFSKDAVIKGRFDKYGESSKGKKGTTTVDKAFLTEIENWRELLAKNFAKNNKITEDELKFATQRTLDRIIFLRICEARGIEEEGKLLNAVESSKPYFALLGLFNEADNKYNSGLFHFRKGDKAHTSEAELDTITPKLKLDDKILKEIVGGLYYPSPYKFDVIPADILGQVYEQFLGKVIRMTAGGNVKIEEKPEVRKAGGVYYTPTYIVDYIVKNTVGKMLEANSPSLSRRGSGGGYELKILDPACGSGSFLLGAYDYLLKWYLAEYAKDAASLLKKKNSPIYQISEDSYALTTAEKKRILLEHIYGVDIDENAVEVAKLNLMLKCLEGEVAATMKLAYERILPDLSDNIKCGNSLIGPDFNDGLFSNDEHKKINPFDWHAEFSDIMGKGGFDVVIGNPPYIRMEAFKEIKTYLKKCYYSHDERTDLYVYFIEKSIKLLRDNGRFGYIVANRWIRSKYGVKLREFILKNTALQSIVDFGELKVFSNAATMPAIVTLQKGLTTDSYSFNYVPPVSKAIFEKVTAHTIDVNQMEDEYSLVISSDKLRDAQWKLTYENKEVLLDVLRHNATTLYEYVQGKIRYGIKTGLVDAFIIGEEEKNAILSTSPASIKYIKEYLVGDDIRKYNIRDKHRYIIYTDKTFKISENEGIVRHLEQFKKKLESRATKQEWYELQQPQFAYEPDYTSPKIIYPDIAKESRFAYDDQKRYPADTTFVIPTSDKALLGILNSKLAWFYFCLVCPVLGDVSRGGRLRLKYNYVRDFPLKISNQSLLKRIENNVDHMLTLNKELPLAKTPSEKTRIERQISSTDSEIDKLVYELYELTEEEIGIVEG